MEKPFGTDLASAVALNNEVHQIFDESQIFRIDHFLGKEAAQNILAFRFANGLFEPIWNRNFIQHVQIDVPETLGLEGRTSFYESTGAYRDMVVTHLMQVLAFMAMEPPTSLLPGPISDEKLKVFRSMKPIEPHDVVRGQYGGYRGKEEVAEYSDTETFIALKIEIDNWRWAGVPFFLRTGKKLAEGARVISIAFKEPPLSMFPAGSNAGMQGPDHLTFDLADQSRMSLSFYGKRPGPGMQLEKLSMQFATHETGSSIDVLEAYERLILDAMRGDHTLFTTAAGIETLWEKSIPLLQNPPPVRAYSPGSWGPNAIHQLVAPHAWRLPFERSWRDPNAVGQYAGQRSGVRLLRLRRGRGRLGRLGCGGAGEPERHPGRRRTASGRPRRCRRAARRPAPRSRGRGRSRASRGRRRSGRSARRCGGGPRRRCRSPRRRR